MIPTALIVDDNFFNRDLCKLALEHVGYAVEEAEDGQQALNRLEDQTFDMLVLDLQMPQVDGLDVIRELAMQPRHQNMSVIVMTANAHMATDEVEGKVDFIVYKPIDVSEFAQLAQRLIKRVPRLS